MRQHPISLQGGCRRHPLGSSFLVLLRRRRFYSARTQVLFHRKPALTQVLKASNSGSDDHVLVRPTDAKVVTSVQTPHHGNDGLFRHSDCAGDFLAALPGSAVVLDVIEAVADAVGDLAGTAGQLRIYENLIEPQEALLLKFRGLSRKFIGRCLSPMGAGSSF